MFRRKKPAPPAPHADDATVQPLNRLAPRSPSDAIKPAAAPPPPSAPLRRERGGLLSVISGVLTLLVVLALGALIGVVILDRRVDEPGPLSADKVVIVPPRSGVGEIATVLANEGVIASPTLFELAARFDRKPRQLKAGEYLFKAHASITDAIETLTDGKPIQHAITIPEGLTSEQIVGRLTDNEALSGDIAAVPPEGSLLPDTYKFERGFPRNQVLNQMRAKQREVLNQIWSHRAADLPIKSPQDLVTLASIVEKETGRADERPRVAGVFVNRLQRKMRLQSDPTIVYGLVGGRGTLGRGIQRAEIQRPTPYNTYVIDGLPPGPIANPGRAAMEATANPARTKDIYFVADGTGGHAFAENLDQHQRNVVRWRQIEGARPADPAASADKIDPNAADPGAATQPAPGAPARPGLTSSPMAYDPQGLPPGARSRAFDASEGTALDPLRNKTYDLTSPKTVPVLRNP
jgi:UPF0755 protein